jgi:hypothetical protein
MESANMSDSTTIAVREFKGLSEGGNANALLEANLGGASLTTGDLTWVKIPTGGATRWSWSTKSGNEFSEKAITGLLVVVGKVRATLWPHTESSSGTKPLLVSYDGKVAVKTGDDYGDLDPNVIASAKLPDGTYDISRIPYFQWQGSGPGSKPPRAKSTRDIGILRENESTPVFIKLSSTSLRPIDNLLRGITSEGLYHYRTVVELTLEKKKGAKADYAVVVARKVGEVDVDQGKVAHDRFTVPFSAIIGGPNRQGNASAASSEDVPF